MQLSLLLYTGHTKLCRNKITTDGVVDIPRNWCCSDIRDNNVDNDHRQHILHKCIERMQEF